MNSTHDDAPLPVIVNKRWFLVRSPKGDQPRRVVFLAPKWSGYWVHWQGCALPCDGTHDCPRCKAGQPNRWQGYIATWDLVQHDRCIDALSEGTARQLEALHLKYGTLRGVAVSIKRRFPRKVNSSCIVTELGRQNPAETFDEHPIRDSLNRLWGLNDQYSERRTGGANLPPRPPCDVTAEVPFPEDDGPVPGDKPVTGEQWRRLRESVADAFKME